MLLHGANVATGTREMIEGNVILIGLGIDVPLLVFRVTKCYYGGFGWR